MYRNIIVGYDGSNEAEDALALAGLLRDREGVVTAATDDESAVPEPREWLRTHVFPAGSGAAALPRLVHHSGADLFVLGSSSRAAAGRTLTGPVGRRLLFGSPCSAAIAPKGFRRIATGPRTVGIAFETEDEALHAVDEGTRLAQSLGASARLICLVPPLAPWALDAGTDAGYTRGDVERHHRETCQHTLDHALDAVAPSVPAEGRLVEGAPASALAAETGAGVDLLVLASPGVRPVPGVRPGATAMAVMRSSPCPVLLTPTGIRRARAPVASAAG